MRTLKEYLADSPMMLNAELLVCPKRDGYQKHIFTYRDIKLSSGNLLCDIGSHPHWESRFSEYTGTWISTDDVLVVERYK